MFKILFIIVCVLVAIFMLCAIIYLIKEGIKNRHDSDLFMFSVFLSVALILLLIVLCVFIYGTIVEKTLWPDGFY